MAFWIPLMDIPLGFQNKVMGKRLGDALGEFLEAECDQENYCWGESLRLKVIIDITKPLRRGIWIEPGEGLDSLWIHAKYEILPDFCYGCGRIGHVVKECQHFSGEDRIETEPFQYGSWLRYEGSNPRRRRKTSSPRSEKEESPVAPSTQDPPSLYQGDPPPIF